ncbi:MAG: ATPase [Rickettsiaceae bacterium]|nr:MAG: ATPase [Rickettsiaceae bacterium]
MNQNNKPRIFVIGNEKGGAGKTTCSMHLIAGLLDRNYKVASIDADSRQHSLTNYVNNRIQYNIDNHNNQVPLPLHYHIHESKEIDIKSREEEDTEQFREALEKASEVADFIVIDTPGSHTYLSSLAHSYADTIITPINDSFLDIDVIAKIEANDLNVVSPSIYSQMIWEQKMKRIDRNKESIQWIVMRNRLSNLDALNKRKVAKVLNQLSKRISFKLIEGFSERVIFKELFLEGLTLLDTDKVGYNKTFNISHVAARQELRNFLNNIGIL